MKRETKSEYKNDHNKYLLKSQVQEFLSKSGKTMQNISGMAALLT